MVNERQTVLMRAHVSSSLLWAVSFFVAVTVFAAYFEIRLAPTAVPGGVKVVEHGRLAPKADPTLGDIVAANVQEEVLSDSQKLAVLSPEEKALIDDLFRTVPEELEKTHREKEAVEWKAGRALDLQDRVIALRQAGFAQFGEEPKSPEEKERIDEEISQLWASVKDLPQPEYPGAAWSTLQTMVHRAAQRHLAGKLTVQDVEDVKTASRWVDSAKSYISELDSNTDKLLKVLDDLGVTQGTIGRSEKSELANAADPQQPRAAKNPGEPGSSEHLLKQLKEADAMRQHSSRVAVNLYRNMFVTASSEELERGLAESPDRAGRTRLLLGHLIRFDDKLAVKLYPNTTQKLSIAVQPTPLASLVKDTQKKSWLPLLRRDVDYFDAVYSDSTGKVVHETRLFFWSGAKWIWLGGLIDAVDE